MKLQVRTWRLESQVPTWKESACYASLDSAEGRLGTEGHSFLTGWNANSFPIASQPTGYRLSLVKCRQIAKENGKAARGQEDT